MVLDDLILKFTWKSKKIVTPENLLYQMPGLTVKLWGSVELMQVILIGQRSITMRPETETSNYDRANIAEQWVRNGLFSKCCWGYWKTILGKMELLKYYSYSNIQKIILSWIKYLNAKGKYTYICIHTHIYGRKTCKRMSLWVQCSEGFLI